MKPKNRIKAVLDRKIPDRVPRCEVWIDALLEEMGQKDLVNAHVNLEQDAIMMPTEPQPGSNAWKNGIDEWGREWKNGIYINGVVQTRQDIKRYSLPVNHTERYFNKAKLVELQEKFPDHLWMYGSHLGPFMAAYMAMGFESFFVKIMEDESFIHELMENRVEWTIAMLKAAHACGAELLVLGEDAAHNKGTMISPRMWKKFLLPYHKRITAAVDCPIIFHSDGNIMSVLPYVIEAGFIGYHSVEPASGMDLKLVKAEYGKDLILVGNVDVRLLAGNNLEAVRMDVDRCINDGAPGGGFMLSTCNSIFDGLNPAAVMEYFNYSRLTGKYN